MKKLLVIAIASAIQCAGIAYATPVPDKAAAVAAALAAVDVNKVLLTNAEILDSQVKQIIELAPSHQDLVDQFIRIVAVIAMKHKIDYTEYVYEIQQSAPKQFRIAMDRLPKAQRDDLLEYLRDYERMLREGQG